MLKDLIDWSQKNYSDLPWRQRRSLYHTLVSEIMLQQTTVGTVINHFDRFLKVFPDIKTLSKASEEQMLIEWKGLGYYRRARNLLKAAKFIQNEFQGEIPLDYDLLISIPGVGDYTANAILSIGADQFGFCLDANLERVLSRIYRIEGDKGPKQLKRIKLASEQFSKDFKGLSARAFNEALMDLGRVFCQSKKAECLLCPMNDSCESAFKADVLNFPKLASKKKKDKEVLQIVRFFIWYQGKILAVKRDKGLWLEGQYEVPSYLINSDLHQYPQIKMKPRGEVFSTVITKYKIENYIIETTKSDLEKKLRSKIKDYIWLKPTSKRFSTAMMKALKKMPREK